MKKTLIFSLRAIGLIVAIFSHPSRAYELETLILTPVYHSVSTVLLGRASVKIEKLAQGTTEISRGTIQLAPGSPLKSARTYFQNEKGRLFTLLHGDDLHLNLYLDGLAKNTLHRQLREILIEYQIGDNIRQSYPKLRAHWQEAKQLGYVPQESPALHAGTYFKAPYTLNPSSDREVFYFDSLGNVPEIYNLFRAQWPHRLRRLWASGFIAATGAASSFVTSLFSMMYPLHPKMQTYPVADWISFGMMTSPGLLLWAQHLAGTVDIRNQFWVVPKRVRGLPTWPLHAPVALHDPAMLDPQQFSLSEGSSKLSLIQVADRDGTHFFVRGKFEEAAAKLTPEFLRNAIEKPAAWIEINEIERKIINPFPHSRPRLQLVPVATPPATLEMVWDDPSSLASALIESPLRRALTFAHLDSQSGEVVRSVAKIFFDEARAPRPEDREIKIGLSKQILKHVKPGTNEFDFWLATFCLDQEPELKAFGLKLAAIAKAADPEMVEAIFTALAEPVQPRTMRKLVVHLLRHYPHLTTDALLAKLREDPSVAIRLAAYRLDAKPNSLLRGLSHFERCASWLIQQSKIFRHL